MTTFKVDPITLEVMRNGFYSIADEMIAFADEHILAGSAQPWLHRWSINGRLAAKLPLATPSAFALTVNTASLRNKVLVAGGVGPTLDVYTNYFHRAFELTTL